MSKTTDRNESPFGSYLGWLELSIVLIFTPLILLPGRIVPMVSYPWMVATLFLTLPLRLLLYGRTSRRTPADWPLLLLLLILPINLLVAIDRETAWIGIGYLLLGIAAYSVLVHWPPLHRRPQRFAAGILGVAAALALVGLALTAPENIPLVPLLAVNQMLQPLSVLLGESVNTNVLAGNLALATSFAFGIALGRATPTSTRLLAGFLCLALTLLLALSGSRGAVLAEGAGLLLVIWLHFPRLGLGTAGFALAALSGVRWWAPQRLLELMTISDLLGGLEARFAIYAHSLFALEDFALSGVGMGNFQAVVPLLYPSSLLRSGDIPHAHNLLLQVGLDLGVVGLVAWLAIQLIVFSLLIGVIGRRGFTPERDLAIAVLGALATIHLHGLVDAVTWGTKLAFFPWLFFALAFVLKKKAASRSGQIIPSTFAT